MYKFIALALTFAFVIALTGCGGSAEKTDDASDKAPAVEEKKTEPAPAATPKPEPKPEPAAAAGDDDAAVDELEDDEFADLEAAPGGSTSTKAASH